MIAPLPNDESNIGADARGEHQHSVFDDILRVAAYTCRTPFAAISLFTAGLPCFSASFGLQSNANLTVDEFWAHFAFDRGHAVVEDTLLDARFAALPCVVNEPSVRFYAGEAVFDVDGAAIGVLCIMDVVPRQIDPEQLTALKLFAQHISGLVDRERQLASQNDLRKERDRTQAALIRSEGLVQAAYEHAPIGIAIADLQYHYLTANNAFCEITGYTRDEVMNLTMESLTHPDDFAATDSLDRKVKTGYIPSFTLEKRYIRKDNSVVWVQNTISILRDEKGEAENIIVLVQDITRRRQAEEAKNEIEAKYRGLVESNIIGVGTWRPDGRILWANDRFLDMTGYTREELDAGLVQWDQMTPPEWKDVTTEKVAMLLKRGSTDPYEKEYFRKDGTRLPVMIGSAWLDDKLSGVAYILDLTQLKAAESSLESEQQRFRSLVEGLGAGLIMTDLDGVIQYTNPRMEQITGYAPDEMAGRNAIDLLCAADQRQGVHERFNARKSSQSFSYEIQIQKKDGVCRWIEMHAVPYCAGSAEPIGILATVTDISDRILAESALRERTELLESILATIPHLVFWKDRNCAYLGCNEQFARICGLSEPDEVVGKTDEELSWTPDEVRVFRDADRKVLDTGAAITNLEETCRHADGTTSVELTSKRPLHGPDGEIIGVLGIAHDITDRKKLEAEREALLAETERLLGEARERADRDPVTNLLNHRAFYGRLNHEAASAKARNRRFGVAVLDLNNFKFFNDSYGHVDGDSVLRLVARRIEQVCDQYATIARFGGDEFALILRDVGDQVPAQIADRLQLDIGSLSFLPEGHSTPIPITVTAGVALYPCDGTDHHDLLRLADERLIRAKTGGGSESEARQVRELALKRVEGFSMLDSLVAAVDNKDRYTRRHSEDVMAYSLMIARKFGLDEQYQKTVAIAALLHDVGKIGVPDSILRKPGELTEEEFAAIKQHPQMGAILVQAVPGLEDTLDAVRHHHERWDGAGYPYGLAGEEIPFIARLMAVADAYSAMTTDRPYRRGMSRAKAISILEQGANSQWDANCVRSFVRALSDSDAEMRAA
jgi:diguanylate cyclase (GGDEF)-like protein/PAS domain S-box-containing protein